MYYEENLFETIMSLSYTEIPYQSPNNKRRIIIANHTKPKKQSMPKSITLDSRYSYLVAEGSRTDIKFERRMEIRKELTLIRQQKRMMLKMEYHM